MRSILITGISGFVGGHLAEYLHRLRPEVAIHGMSRSIPSWDFISSRESLLKDITFHAGDMQDASWVDATIRKINPDAIIQLAAQSSVAESWKNPRGTVLNNLSLLLNVFEAVRRNDLGPRILNVGSSEVYGSVTEQDLPLQESHKVYALNPYAVARVAQEQLAAIYCDSYHFSVVSTRSFNHIGPGQDTRFVVSSIAKQVAEIARGKRDPVLMIGNGSIIRDFLDVRNVVEAYLKLVERGRSGEVYNVCSGTGRKIADIIAVLSSIAGISVQVRTSADLMRPLENPIIVGSNEKIRHEIGWQPRISFEESVRAIYDYWYNRV